MTKIKNKIKVTKVGNRIYIYVRDDDNPKVVHMRYKEAELG